jgi:hypothetical protein
LYLAEERLAQVGTKSLHRRDRANAVGHPAQRADHRQAHHRQAGLNDLRHVQVCDAVVYDALDHARLHQVQGDVDQHQHGR